MSHEELARIAVQLVQVFDAGGFEIKTEKLSDAMFVNACTGFDDLKHWVLGGAKITCEIDDKRTKYLAEEFGLSTV